MAKLTNEVRGPSPGLSGTIAHMEEEFKELEHMSRPRWPMALVVVLLAGAAAGGYFWFGRDLGSSRPSATAAAVEGVRIEVSEPRDGARLTSAPADFSWESIAGRSDYLFTLKLEGSPAALLERTSKTSKLQLTEDEWKPLGSGSYAWTVRARAKDGTVLGTGNGRFEVR